MSIFKSILSKIFNNKDEASTPPADELGAEPTPTQNTGSATGAGVSTGGATTGTAGGLGGAGSTAPAGQTAAGGHTAPVGQGQGTPAGVQQGSADRAAPSTAPEAGATATPSAAGSMGEGSAGSAQTVDVEDVLSRMQEQHPEQLNWRTSIVDLMKLLGLDSSLAARKELATELNYTGSTDDSAAMNMWLHKQVMRKLAENGGRVPEDLRN